MHIFSVSYRLLYPRPRACIRLKIILRNDNSVLFWRMLNISVQTFRIHFRKIHLPILSHCINCSFRSSKKDWVLVCTLLKLHLIKKITQPPEISLKNFCCCFFLLLFFFIFIFVFLFLFFCFCFFVFYLFIYFYLFIFVCFCFVFFVFCFFFQ